MTTLTLTIESKNYEITFKDKQGTIKIPYSTKLPVKARVATVTLSAKAKGVKVGDTLTILASESFTLTITAEDKTTTQEYTVTVEKGEAPSSEAAITTLTLTVGDSDYEITFTGTQDTITLSYGTEIPTAVEVKQIALSVGAKGVADDDELAVTNNAVTITVTAADGTTTQEYTVRLIVSAGITSFTFEVPDNENMALDTADRKRIVGKIDQQTKTITFDRQSAYVYLDKLKATFEVSEAGAAVQVADENQESGTTKQDFTSPVSYVVSAEGTETTYTVTLAKSTMATIPDAQFRTKLKDFIPAAFTEDQLDIMHDDVVNSVALGAHDETPKLTSLKGIEFFTALIQLSCYNNALTSSLDLSKNTALTELYCGDNALTSLDLSKNTALTQLYCSANALTSLDVSKNTALTTLNCSANDLASLNVSANAALETLYCDDNGLASLNVSGNRALLSLTCTSNSLTSLDVSANTALMSLFCNKNSLTSLDMTGMRSVLHALALNIGTGIGEKDNPLETLRVNTAIQDNAVIITMKTARKAALTITTVNDAGEEDCANYTPAIDGGNCN